MTDLLDVLRLDVAAGPPNLLGNHSGQLGRTGATAFLSWRDHASPSAYPGADIVQNTGQAYGWQGFSIGRSWTMQSRSIMAPRVPAVAGRYTNASFVVRMTARNYTPALGQEPSARIRLTFIKSNGTVETTVISQRVPLALNGDKRVIGNAPILAPALTTHVDAALLFDTPGNSEASDLGVTVAVFEGMVGQGTYPEDVLSLQFSAGAPINVLGPSLNVTVKRGLTRQGVTDDLEPGELTATVRDVAGDISPEVNRFTRPNAPVNVRVLVAGQWRNLFTGRITKGAAVRAGTKARPLTNVNLTAADAVATLANTPRAEAIAGTLEQRLAHVLNGTGRRWATVAPVPAPAPTTPAITKAETTSALEQLTRLRDTLHGYAWVDASDVVQARDASRAPSSAPAVTFTDQPGDVGLGYVDIDVDYGTDALTNSLIVNRVNLDEVTEDDDSGTKQYGPYTAADSALEWGTFADEVTVTEGTSADHAAYFLADQSRPRTTVRSITLNVDPAAAGLLSAATLELYTCVRIRTKTAAGVHDALYRIIGVEHQLTARKWLTIYTTRPLEVPVGVELGVPAAGPNTGPGDITAPAPTPHADRHRSTDFAIAAAAITSIPFDAFTVQDAGLAWDAVNRWFTVTKAGLYQVNAGVLYQAGTGGARQLRIHVNGAIRFLNQQTAVANAAHSLTGAKAIRLAAGDKVAVAAYSAVAINILGGLSATVVDITRIGT